ncbi:hypothetical protein B8W66_13065 [Mycobacterium decipiens]|uniref:DUF3515 domain-containing protein n=1 Tax=Mycobacterium decipiens TaxID=1430326 RepID=A0A1X2LU83_9MYCO|nr:DUF3515 domain-containing protein [Mycobacterium decipiens]OSC40471.1 hypothetical protein B8W66_13065 [Mycobacterium decipiens]
MTAESDGPPRALMIAAVALAVVTIGVILVVAANRQAPEHPPKPLAIPAVPAPQAASPACKALVAALPQQLGEYQRAPVTSPAPEGATAWRAPPDGAPVIMRCGLDRPAEFVVGSPVQVVDRVQWFRVTAESAGEPGRSTWYTVDRPVYVALTLPSGSGPTPIQELSDVIDHTIAAVPIDPAPAR